MPAILLTRPAPASARFADKLRRRLGEVEIVIAPLLRIDWKTVPLPTGVPIFTSQTGVEGFLRAGGAAQGPCWCVGDATAQAARNAGFDPRSAAGDAAALVAKILESGDSGPYLHLRGAHARGDVAERLRQAGCQVEEAILYDQVAQDLTTKARDLLKSERPVILPLFSPRTAAQFAKVSEGTAPLFVAAMSTAVQGALNGVSLVRLLVADRPDAQAMADTTERLLDAALQLEGERGAK